MENNEKQFIEGFNNGYLLAKHEPVLLDKIAKTVKPINDYMSGLISGKEEYENEIEHSKIEELNQLRIASKIRDRDFNKEH